MSDKHHKHHKQRGPAILIDLQRCIGCNACSLACKQENNVQIGQRWAEVYGGEDTQYPTQRAWVLPMLCHQCERAPCKARCDSLGYHAIKQRRDGILYVDPDLCVGCEQCIPVCPYKTMFFNTETRKAQKCHFCMHRIDAGLEPACVITCLAITRHFGDYEQLKQQYNHAESMKADGVGNVRVLYANLKGKPKRPTSGYPSPIPCHEGEGDDDDHHDDD